jgi:hypothetical protein
MLTAAMGSTAVKVGAVCLLEKEENMKKESK